MANKLKNMKLTSVDLVKAGANQKADIRLYKSADGTTTQDEAEKGIFKRFLNWLYETTASDEAIAGMEDSDPVEKGDNPETADIYKSAITESIQSIIADKSLSTEEKNDMVEKSLEQYHEKMMGLAKAEPEQIPDPEDDPEDDNIDDEPTADSEDIPEPDYDEIEEVENPVKKK